MSEMHREDVMRQRIGAQIRGEDWTKSGDVKRFGDVGARTSPYSAAELRALIPVMSKGSDWQIILPQLVRAISVSGQAREAVAAGRGGTTDARVTVDFANAPKGTRVSADPQSTANVDLSVGYQMNPGAL